MDLHQNARSCPASRAVLVERVLRQRWTVREAAESAGMSERRAYVWLARFRAEGQAGLQDRSSRPYRIARQMAADRAALFNGALVRYLDDNDSYLAKGETCHPSDNLAAVLAAAEYADASGRDLLTALAVAYQVQCRLSDEAPVRARGFDHTTQGSYAAAAGVARAHGLTEIRGPYYSVLGLPYLTDLLETWGEYVDSLKFAGGSFTLMPQAKLRQVIDVCHAHDVPVSTGGFIEHVLTQGPEAVDRYIAGYKDVGFDIVEISGGFITIPTGDWLRLVERVQKAGLKAKPEVGIQFGAGGTGTPEELEAAGQRDVSWILSQARRLLDAGAYLIMIESEGITESVRSWRTDVPARVIGELGTEKVMFEAADPDVFAWYVKNFGPEVNLFVDHSQIVQLEVLRRGLSGKSDVWGRILTYKG
jgi:phosphosulfolactate synthase (CoM biosynthesis protein A)